MIVKKFLENYNFFSSFLYHEAFYLNGYAIMSVLLIDSLIINQKKLNFSLGYELPFLFWRDTSLTQSFDSLEPILSSIYIALRFPPRSTPCTRIYEK